MTADEEIGLEISTTSETKLTKQEEKEFIEEDPYPSSLLSDENSSLPMAQSVVDTPLPMTQGILFVISNFVGSLIGHIFIFMNWVVLVLLLIQKNSCIRFILHIRSNKYLW